MRDHAARLVAVIFLISSSLQPASAKQRAADPRRPCSTPSRDYLISGEFKEKRDSTKAEYRRVLEALAERHGSKPVRDLRRRRVRKMRDERAETPGAANTIVRMLKLILNFAIEEELIEANPAAKVKLLKVGEWRAWSDEERAAFEKRWAPGTMERRAYALALFTGQRKGDLVLMTRGHRKNGEESWIREHQDRLPNSRAACPAI